MKKRILSLLLALAMAGSISAYAAQNSTQNFVRQKTYAGQFSDVTAASTFYSNVAALYEYGLSVGKANGTFGLQDSLTVGQVLIFAGRIRSLYATGDAEAGARAQTSADTAVYQPYLAYLQSVGALGSELDGSYSRPATRAQVAHVLASTLPDGVLAPVNQDLVTQAYATRKFISDVTEYTDYYQDILTLYRCGISQGSDASGSFYPDAVISRGAAAAMLTRMVDESLRVTPEWNVSAAYSASGTTWGSLITGNTTYTSAPYTQTQVENDVAYMLSQGSSSLNLSYGKSVSSSFVSQVMNQALGAVKADCEQLYNSIRCTYDSVSGTVNLRFYATACSASELASYRTYTLSAAIAVHDQLWKDGVITSDMSEYDKAKVYFNWICENCQYDYGAGENSVSHLGYALFKNGTAVCDGYTGAYNLFLKLEGIDCWALSNDTHIWTVATLDGTSYHIDTTWGDSTGSSTNYDYFAMTPAQSWAAHPW